MVTEIYILGVWLAETGDGIQIQKKFAITKQHLYYMQLFIPVNISAYEPTVYLFMHHQLIKYSSLSNT